MSVSLIIPVYNFERRLPATLAKLRAYLKHKPSDWEIIFVDDGSTDGTLALLNELAPPLRAVSLGVNRGKGAAVRRGVEEAKGKHVMFTDVDLPYGLEPIEAARRRLNAGAEVVLGSRKEPGSQHEVPQQAMRQVPSAIFSFLTRAVAGAPFRDTQCGFKAFSNTAARRIFSETRIDRFAFDVEAIVIASKAGLAIEILPVRLIDDDPNSVSMLRDGPQMLADLVDIYWRTRSTFEKDLHYGLALGAVMGVLALPILRNIGLLSATQAVTGLASWATALLYILAVPVGADLAILLAHRLFGETHLFFQIVRYGIVGVFNTILNASIFNTLLLVSGIARGPAVVLFSAIAFAIVITQAFFVNRAWVFRGGSGRKPLQEFIRFCAVSVSVALLDILIIHLMVNVIGAPAGIAPLLWDNIALAVTIVVSVVGNFTGYKLFAFK